MLFQTVLVLALTAAWAALYRNRRTLGSARVVTFGLLAALAAAGGWAMVGRMPGPVEPAAVPVEPAVAVAVTAQLPSQTCLECHANRHASWRNSFHRTMTTEAGPETVKANFNDATLTYKGVTSRMYREGDRFLIDTIDPLWAVRAAASGNSNADPATAPRKTFTVDRIVGSHWFQQMIHRDDSGQYLRLPLVYHLVENRWIHTDGAFLMPDAPHFFGAVQVWDESCLFCHNTRPTKRLEPRFDGPPAYLSEVAELGISCEACHGAGDAHVRAHKGRTPALAVRGDGTPDPNIVNPARLETKRSVDVCARCHGIGPKPRLAVWNPETQGDPFRPGEDLARTHFPFWSESALATEYGYPPDPIDGRFWGDGTPLTTALEYQGMALSKCYQAGAGKMTCLTCHTMHGSDPDHQLKPGMRTNEACYTCHETYRADLVKHTHHPSESPGSNCLNCHMPNQVYALLTTHRTHRISVPRVGDTVATGKPNACNLCHLDKSMGWTSEKLQAWYGTKPEPLSDDERSVATGVLHLMKGDVRSRAIVTGAFGWEPARQASGRDWAVPVLLRALEQERYAAARYLEHRSLKALCGDAAAAYDYLANPSARAQALKAMKAKVMAGPRLDASRYPFLSLSPEGAIADSFLDRLLRARTDPDITVRE